MTLISGCGGGSSATTGTASMNVADAPVDDENVLGVYVAFDAVEYKPASSEWVVDRITSYNVCYTKLLRRDHRRRELGLGRRS